MLRKILIGTVLAILLGGFYGTPWLALHEIRKAARANDLEQLNNLIDFPQLRENVRLGVLERLTLSDDGRTGSKARALGAAVAGALLGPMVDAFITPETVATLLRGQRPSTKVGKVWSGNGPEKPLRMHAHYESVNRFVYSIRPAGEDGEKEDPVDFVFYREGLFNWKLAELRLP
ncbi:MAG TPA: DUF2939 domain-containing protein [Burkholderiaceae bacterium]|jgi:hypothetical protein